MHIIFVCPHMKIVVVMLTEIVKILQIDNSEMIKASLLKLGMCQSRWQCADYANNFISTVP